MINSQMFTVYKLSICRPRLAVDNIFENETILSRYGYIIDRSGLFVPMQ